MNKILSKLLLELEEEYRFKTYPTFKKSLELVRQNTLNEVIECLEKKSKIYKETGNRSQKDQAWGVKHGINESIRIVKILKED